MLDRTASGGDDFIVQLADLDCRFCFNGAKACLSAFLENFRNGLSGLFDNDIIQVNELLLHTVLQHFANGCLAGRGHSDQYDIAALAQHILIDIVDDLIVDTLIQEELHGLLCLCYQHLQTVYTLDIHFLRLEAQSCQNRIVDHIQNGLAFMKHADIDRSISDTRIHSDRGGVDDDFRIQMTGEHFIIADGTVSWHNIDDDHAAS